jgi:hypothetical protein
MDQNILRSALYHIHIDENPQLVEQDQTDMKKPCNQFQHAIGHSLCKICGFPLKNHPIIRHAQEPTVFHTPEPEREEPKREEEPTPSIDLGSVFESSPDPAPDSPSYDGGGGDSGGGGSSGSMDS